MKKIEIFLKFLRWLIFGGCFAIYPKNFFLLLWLWTGKAGRWFLWLLNVFLNYATNPNILTLLVVLAIGWGSGFGYASFRGAELLQIGSEKMEASIWCLRAMFDVSFVIENLKFSNGGWFVLDGMVLLGLFLFTWLIGGGALISSIISTMHDNHHGAWRKWSWLLTNHALIIGWNDNGPTVIREHLESMRLPLLKTPWGVWAPKRPERIVVITSGDAYEISKAVKLAIGNWHRRLRVSYDVYHGTYDSAYERKRLAIKRALAVYVLGDEGEPAHDARVLLWPALAGAFNNTSSENRNKRLGCAVNISSYPLYSQWLRQKASWANHRGRIADVGGRPINVTSFNFFDSWAKRLFSRLDVKIGLKSRSESTSKVLIRDPKVPHPVHIVIIGFSQMGQALLAELARDCHYATDDKTIITVIDEDIAARRIEFESIYPRINEVPDLNIEWVKVDKLGSAEFITLVGSFIAKQRQLTLIVAHDDPAISMGVAMPIINGVYESKKNARVLLRQEVKGVYGDWRVANTTYGGITVFGMRDGAGFGLWWRDSVSEKMLSYNSNGAPIRDWHELTARELGRYRHPVDALSQILSSLEIEVLASMPSPLSRKRLLFDVDLKSTPDEFLSCALADRMGRSFLKAFHKQWCAAYLLSDDGNCICDEDSDYRLTQFENLEDDPTRRGLLALSAELLCLVKALAECGLYLCVRNEVHANLFVSEKTTGASARINNTLHRDAGGEGAKP